MKILHPQRFATAEVKPPRQWLSNDLLNHDDILPNLALAPGSVNHTWKMATSNLTASALFSSFHKWRLSIAIFHVCFVVWAGRINQTTTWASNSARSTNNVARAASRYATRTDRLLARWIAHPFSTPSVYSKRPQTRPYTRRRLEAGQRGINSSSPSRHLRGPSGVRRSCGNSPLDQSCSENADTMVVGVEPTIDELLQQLRPLSWVS